MYYERKYSTQFFKQIYIITILTLLTYLTSAGRPGRMQNVVYRVDIKNKDRQPSRFWNECPVMRESLPHPWTRMSNYQLVAMIYVLHRPIRAENASM